MPLVIETRPTLIGWHTKDAVLKQSGQGEPALNIDITDPQLRVDSKPPKLSIDQSECFAEAGLKDIKRMMSDHVSKAKQQLMEGIQIIVQQGNEMADVHNGNPIPTQAKYNAYDRYVKEFNYGTVPKSRPKISVASGDVQVKVSPGKVENKSKPKPLRSSYERWKVDFYIRQRGRVDINYVKNQTDYYI